MYNLGVPFIRSLALASLAPPPSLRSGCTLYLFFALPFSRLKKKDAAAIPHAKSPQRSQKLLCASNHRETPNLMCLICQKTFVTLWFKIFKNVSAKGS